MALMKVPLTKSTLLRLRRDVVVAQDGYNLLEQKREVLILELMQLLDQARSIQEEVDKKLQKAYQILTNAELEVGSYALQKLVLGVKYEHELEIQQHRVMGTSLPKVDFKTDVLKLQFALAGSTAHTDAVMAAFLEVLEAVTRLAYVETSVTRLALEIKKTLRRVNALEKIFIPNYHDTIRFIVEMLEEKDRESFFTMKLVKKRLQEKAGKER